MSRLCSAGSGSGSSKQQPTSRKTTPTIQQQQKVTSSGQTAAASRQQQTSSIVANQCQQTSSNWQQPTTSSKTAQRSSSRSSSSTQPAEARNHIIPCHTVFTNPTSQEQIPHYPHGTSASDLCQKYAKTTKKPRLSVCARSCLSTAVQDTLPHGTPAKNLNMNA